MWVHDLAAADASCGGKAVGLARLIAAGLPVPDGFAIDDAAFRAVALPFGRAAGRALVAGPPSAAELSTLGHELEHAAQAVETTELPADFVREVEARAAALGDRVIVRSSATIEDGEAGAAAGVFSSRVVAIADLWPAIRAVWSSALTPLAAAYARRRGAAIAIGVVVQRHVAGEPVTIYTRPPGDPTGGDVLVQRGSPPTLLRVRRESTDGAAQQFGGAAAGGQARDVELALHAERAIAAPKGADVELVGEWVVQARPIVHPRANVLVPPPDGVLAPLRDGRVWTWDIAHNPDPLSPAQQGLVERVAAAAHHELRVVAGYLYSTPRRVAPVPQIRTRTELVARAAELEAELATILAGKSRSLAEAIERYVAFYAIWAGRLSPLIAAAGPRNAELGARPSAVESQLAAAARGELAIADVETTLGVLAPAWDVAVPTFGEQPGAIRAAIARAAAIPKPPPLAVGSPDLELARAAADLAERDDTWFARAQWLVREALLRRADELGIDRDDAAWLPLAELAGASGPSRDDAHRRARAARAAADRAARWHMPVSVGAVPRPAGPALHGVGAGPQVTGRVVRFASLASAIAVGRGDVVVTRAVTPALAIFVVGCAAIVSETGGLLDHGAALARELGVTCVVGCRDAWSQLAAGAVVTVDGDAGSIDVYSASSS